MGSELLNIRIMMPVDSDEEFLAVKKKLTDAIADKPDALIDITTRTRSSQKVNDALRTPKQD